MNNVFNDCETSNLVEHSNAKPGATTSALRKILRGLHPSFNAIQQIVRELAERLQVEAIQKKTYEAYDL